MNEMIDFLKGEGWDPHCPAPYNAWIFTPPEEIMKGREESFRIIWGGKDPYLLMMPPNTNEGSTRAYDVTERNIDRFMEMVNAIYPESHPWRAENEES